MTLYSSRKILWGGIFCRLFSFFVLSFRRIWFWVQAPPTDLTMNILLYGSTVLIGAGGSTLLVTSLSMVADLIGCTVVRVQILSRSFHDTSYTRAIVGARCTRALSKTYMCISPLAGTLENVSASEVSSLTFTHFNYGVLISGVSP